MYSREFLEPPKQIVHKGKANFGTFKGVPQRIDIRGLRAPYASLPLPAFLSKLAIKSNLYYFANLDNYISFTAFLDLKVFGLGATTLWNKETGKKYTYHVLMPVRRRFVPKKTSDASCTSFNKARYIRISWGRNHEHHSMALKLKGDSVRPDINGFLYSSIQDTMHCDLTFINPAPVKSRCKATWLSTMQIHGLLKIAGKTADDSNGLGMMLINRAYYGLKNKSSIAGALGSVNNRNIVFTMEVSSMDAANTDEYNNNALIIDGEPTALPPVYMTHSFGQDKPWIIQDTESMIDLTFTPQSSHIHQVHLLPIRSSYKIIYGKYDGVILDKNGEKITLKNFPGLIYDSMIRL